MSPEAILQALSRSAAELPLGDPYVVLDRLLLGFGTFIHGDVHPGNIIMTADGLRFVDWSLAAPSVNLLHLDCVESVPLLHQMLPDPLRPPARLAATAPRRTMLPLPHHRHHTVTRPPLPISSPPVRHPAPARPARA